jgi:hypothetical protein
MAVDQSLLVAAGAGAGAAGAGLGAALEEEGAAAGEEESAGLALSPEAGAAAVTCFSNALAPHAGHTVRGASDIFCRASLAKPQALHL